MIVHLTGSAQNMKEDIPFLRRIIRTLHQNDAVIARDWVEVAFLHHVVKKLPDESVDWRPIMDANLEAISRSEIVIVEGTSYTFSQGFQVAVALQHKKPVLLLSRTPFKARTISGYRNRFLRMEEYTTEDEVAKIVEEFVKENTVSTKDLRFNMFIDRQIYGYLRSESLETGKNKSEIIRDLIMREIGKKGD